MDLIDDLRLYLPQYLSSPEKDHLIKELKQFSKEEIVCGSDLYSPYGIDKNFLYQGDCIKHVPYLSFPDTSVRKIPVIILSNTCDISIENKRMNDCHIIYAPLVNLKKYKSLLENKYDRERIDNHIRDLKLQRISQIMYLPIGGGLDYEAIIFFDRVINLPLKKETVMEMTKNRLVTLNNFGFYLFLLKLSYHFTRIQEKVHRG